MIFQISRSGDFNVPAVNVRRCARPPIIMEVENGSLQY